MRFRYHTRYSDARKLLPWTEGRVAYLLLVLALMAAPFVLQRFWVGELSYIFILAIASLGLMVLKGYTGQVSLGPAAFVAIGAYAHALMLDAGVPFAVSLCLTLLISGAAGLMIGLPAIRVSGLSLAMMTLAFAVIVEHVLGRWKTLTGGFSGLPVETPVLFGFRLGTPTAFYFLCLAILIITLLGLINLMRGPKGRAFVAVRDSEAAAWGLGIDVARTRVEAFVLSSAILGLSGALMAHHVQHLTPEGFGLLLSLELVLMVVIGGLGSLRGALLGAVLIGFLPRLISMAKPLLPAQVSAQFGLEIFAYGLVLAVFVLFEPRGLEGRWQKAKAFLSSFPVYRRDTFRRQKTYMRSERLK
jgi:branched-chain amino acid transport system permease protein